MTEVRKITLNAQQLSELVISRATFASSVSFMESRHYDPQLQTVAETKLRKNYWQSISQVIPGFKLVEIAQGEFLDESGTVNRRDISQLTQEECAQIIPFALIEYIDKIRARIK